MSIPYINFDPNSGCDIDHAPAKDRPQARQLYCDYRDYVYNVMNGHLSIGDVCGEEFIESIGMIGDDFIAQTALVMVDIRKMTE